MRCSWANPARIAIWNWNKGIVGLTIILMGINISFLIHGKSLSTHPADEVEPSQTWFITRYHSSEESIFNAVQFFCADPSAGPLFMDSGEQPL